MHETYILTKQNNNKDFYEKNNIDYGMVSLFYTEHGSPELIRKSDRRK